jgi:hypothetical protein
MVVLKRKIECLEIIKSKHIKNRIVIRRSMEQMEQLDERWGLFWEGLKTIDNESMLYFYIYIVRRLFFVYIVYCLTNYPAF